MNWNDLEAFLAVYREGTYAAAGRALSVNSTTVARRLDRLADDIGAALFETSTDGLVATAAAEAIVPSATAMERQASLIQRRISGDEARLSGVVRLATTPEVATHFLLEHIHILYEQHPRLELNLLSGNQFASLTNGEADIALRFASGTEVPLAPGEPPDGVVARLLGPTDISLVASREYLDRRGTPDPDVGLAGHDLLLQPDVYYLPGMNYLARFEDQANVVFRCDSLAVIMQAAAEGLGITAAPSFFARSHLDLVVLKRNIASRSNWLLMARDLRRVARVRVVRDFLVELFIRWGGVWAGDETDLPPGP